MGMQGTPVDLLNRAVTQLDGLVEGMAITDLTGSTPCAGWDVRALLEHVVGGMRRMSGGTVEGDVLGGDPKAAFKAASQQLLGMWQKPGALEQTYQTPLGEQPGPRFAGIQTMEYAAHSWDLAKATGQMDKLDQPLASILLPIARQALPEGARGEGRPFAAEVTPAAGASPYDQFAAFLGRQP